VEGSEAAKLLQSIVGAEEKADKMLADGVFSAEKAASYKKNARNIGELGIGLNPAATIAGNMLEDEKAFKTCHFAIGSNYDNDAESFIHLDGVVKNPTIVINYKDGSSFVVEKDGILQEL
jgi:leucyl aminopeptidase (aminopeptidase T)